MCLRELALLGAAIAAYFFLESHGGPPEQTWRIRRGSNPGNIRVEIKSVHGMNRSHWNTTVPLSSVPGLTSEMLSRSTGRVQFAILRGAGALMCDGAIRFGSGSGHFTFRPDPDFAGQLKRLGYPEPDNDELWSMAIHEVTLDFARAARDAGVAASTADLIDLRIHGATPEEIEQMQAAGYYLSAADYVQFRIHGVKPEFLRELKSAGYDYEPGKIVDMQIHGVSQEYIRKVNDYGLHVPPDQLVAMRQHGVEPEFLQSVKSLGYRFNTDDIVQLRQNGVDSAYLRKLRDSGYANLNADQITRLRQHGID